MDDKTPNASYKGELKKKKKKNNRKQNPKLNKCYPEWKNK